MEKPSPSTRELARILLAAHLPATDPHGPPGVALVNENLRKSLIEFAGAEGFGSLLRRALALSSAQVPALQNARVRADGHVEGIESPLAQVGTAWESAAMAVTVQMLELLVTFIGERLTRRLVREACPDTSPGE